MNQLLPSLFETNPQLSTATQIIVFGYIMMCSRLR